MNKFIQFIALGFILVINQQASFLRKMKVLITFKIKNT